MTDGCPSCRSMRYVLALTHSDGRLVRCVGCGHVRVEAMPTPAVAVAAYDAGYFEGGTHGYRDYAGEEAVFRAEFRRRLRRIVAGGRAGRLVDVGAATGAFLAEAHAWGFAVAGVEPSPAARTARARGFDVVESAVEGASFPAGTLDVVTVFDALEHIVEPRTTLERIRGWLKPDGRLVVTVPDFGGLWARASGAHWPMITPKEHLHYLTRRTLRGLLARAGFRVRSLELAGTPLSLGTLARRTLRSFGTAVDRALGRLGSRGAALPFGTLLAIASPKPSRSEGASEGRA